MIFHQPGNSRGNYHFDGRYYSDLSYAPHFHKNMELILALEGNVSVTVNGSCESLRAGEAALILSNQIHSFTVPAESRIWVAVFSEDHVPTFLARIKGKQGRHSRFSPDTAVLALLKQHMLQQDSSILMKKACFYALCDAFLAQVPLESRQEKTNFAVGQILDWIAAHYTEDISLQQAAAVFGYEYHYLSRLLNKQYAIRFTSLLNAYRLEHALKLLQETELGMTEIAEQSGFQSIRSFHFSFRQAMGMNPGEYRSSR